MSLRISDLIVPILVYPKFAKHLIPSNQQNGPILVSSDDRIQLLVNELTRKGIAEILLFGLPHKRNESGTGAADEVGAVQNATKVIKQYFGSSVNVITDVCVCQYNLSGHCGITNVNGPVVDNFKSLDLLQKIATSHAKSGADCVAPSSMLDGQVCSIRQALDTNGFRAVKVMSYSAKHASSLYNPFRSIAFAKSNNRNFAIDKSTYQLPYSNKREALREIEHDIEEGADMVMIKPSLWYLDLVYEVKQLIDVPLVVQMVSGEYWMIRTGPVRGAKGDRVREYLRSLISIKRAGSDKVITYISMDTLAQIAKNL